MRICYLADGGSIHTQKWVNYFAEKGYDVHLISLPFTGDLHRNVKLHQLKPLRRKRLFSRIIPAIPTKSLVGSIRPDILHAHYITDYGFWGSLTGYHPFVLTAWGSDVLIDVTASRLSRLSVSFALARATCITCDGQRVLERIVQLGVPRRKIHLVCHGVDTENFNSDKKDPGFKHKLQLPADSLTVISLRNLRPVYDVESLIRAAPIVLARVPRTRFIVAGNGAQRSYLESLARSLGVADAIRFVGLISNDEMPQYLASSDVYVSPSLSDSGISASTAEAMASQLPVVVTDVSDNREWVKDGEGGFVVPPKQPTALAHAIVYLLQNESVRTEFGAINRKIIQQRNEYKEQMKLVERLYQELMLG